MDQPQSEPIPKAFREPTSRSDGHSFQTVSAPTSSLGEQYNAFASDIGLVDRSSLTKLRLARKDSIDLLQRLSTNDLRRFASSCCIHTILTTEKGRVIDLVTLYRLSNSDIILICHAPAEKVFEWIEKFTVMEDVSLSDMTNAYSLFSLFGPGLEKVLQVIGVNQLLVNGIDLIIEMNLGDIHLTLGSAEPISTSNVNLLVQVADANTLWQKLVEDNGHVGLQHCGIDALEICRIEHGFPVYGRELTEEINRLEAGLERFLSFTKGCYIGQEVIARLDTYGKLQKRLVGLLLTGDSGVEHGAGITAQGNDVGWVTSATRSPLLNRPIALAYIRSTCAVQNSRVNVLTKSGSPAGAGGSTAIWVAKQWIRHLNVLQ
jgi:folate-binding protein YgfZ